MLTSLVMREIQTKTTRIYHHIPTRINKIKKDTITGVVGEDVEELDLIHCRWECKMLQVLWKTLWKFLQILNMELPHDPAFPLLGVYPQKHMSTQILVREC